MKTLIDPKVMQACEAAYFRESGAPSIDFMETAARLLCDTLLKHGGKRAYFACGSGGNGGDGYACARMYAQSGGDCTVFFTASPKRADAEANAQRCRNMGIEVLPADQLDAYPRPDIWVDALYGTGLSRAPDDASAALIRRINYDHAFGSRVVAADIPSGLRGDTGLAYPACVQADVTVAFHFPKYGHYLQDGPDVCGEIVSASIGFPEEAFPLNLPHLITSADLKPFFLPRKRNTHKGSYGHLLILAGSFGMAGAAALCAMAALRSGVGLVSIACPESIVPILQTLAPCAMCIPLKEANGAIADGNEAALHRALQGKTAVVVGCGLTQRTSKQAIQAVLECALPAVIDADALNLIAQDDDLRTLLRPHHVLTPHPGEAARLLGRRITSPVSDAQALADMGACVVLKGACRVIATGKQTYLSAAGGCGMARGGSGDSFSGVLGAILAAKAAKQKIAPEVLPMLCAAACEIHGLAGEIAQKRYGSIAMNASDLISALPEVFKTYVE